LHTWANRSREPGVDAISFESIKRAFRLLRGDGLATVLVKGAVGSGGLSVANKALSLLSAIVLSRALGTEGYGYYAFALAAVGFIAIPAQAGLPQLITREVAMSQARSEWSFMRGLQRRSVQLAAASVAAGAIVAGGAMLLLSNWIAALEPVTFAIALLLLPMQVGTAIGGSMLRGLRRVIQGSWPSNVFQPALFVLLVYLFSQGLTSHEAVAINVVSFAVGLAITWWLLGRYWPSEAREAVPQFRTREWLHSLWPFTLIAGIGLIKQKVDILMLGVLASASEVGTYYVAVQGAALVSFPLTACNIVLAPYIAQLHALDDFKRLQRLLTMCTLAVSVASAAAALVLIVAGRWLLANLFGPSFADGYPALVILAIGQLLSTWTGSVGLFLSMTGHERDTLKGIIVAAVLNAVLCLVLIPLLGIVGAAIAGAVSTAVWNILLGVVLYRRLGLIAGPIGAWFAGGRRWMRTP
jgi:O-antigen/teichoic acid export membrane protein